MRGIYERGRLFGAAGAVALLASVAVSASAGAAARHARSPHITLTEEDYFSAPGEIAGLNGYIKQFEHQNPNVTVKRAVVPFADLDSKLLTQAAGGDLPNLLASDNPFVDTMVSTGEVVPLNSFKGFSAKGYYPAVIDEGLVKGKYYDYPVGGFNDLALFYSIPAFKAAHLSPPKTWSQLVSDAKQLTTSTRFGIALTCEAAEDTTWQWEPFFWSNHGEATFKNIASSAGVQALNLLHTLISDGSASKSCLNWTQSPAAIGQFIAGKAAMSVNGPWNFPQLNQSHMFYGKQFGVVPIPVRARGQKVVVPVGGEDWMISKSGNAATRAMAFKFIQGMQTPKEELKLAKGFGYMPAKPSVGRTFVKQEGPEWKVFLAAAKTAHPRTLGLGTKYPKISEDVWTAIQAAVSGSSSVQTALGNASSQIKAILK